MEINVEFFLKNERLELDKECYYHGFYYTEKTLDNIVREGIKAPLLTKSFYDGNNGLFYISLSKNVECDVSAYSKFFEQPKFIISPDIRTFKARNYSKEGKLPSLFKNTPLPFRQCQYDDEYQAFFKVEPKYFLGLQLSIDTILPDYSDSDTFLRTQLQVFKLIIKDLEKLGWDLPIIDTNTSRIIDKEKLLNYKKNNNI